MGHSKLPTDFKYDKSVQDFGIGIYDSSTSTSEHGEDSEDQASEKSPNGMSLPDGGGTYDPFGPDRLLSYASAVLPGDSNTPNRGRKPADDILMNTAESELPNDGKNPSSRSDYYDHMVTGIDRSDGGAEYWPSEDSGAYASDSLPGESNNESELDNFLGALGNEWSGKTIENESSPGGFPSTELKENINYPRSDKGDGRFVASGGSMKVATNFSLVTELSEDFLKKYGKKGLTRRHVMGYLTDNNQPQFLASDIIRSISIRENIIINDVLDEFQVHKTASKSNDLDSILNKVINLAVLYRDDNDVFLELKKVSSGLALSAGLYAKCTRSTNVK